VEFTSFIFNKVHDLNTKVFFLKFHDLSAGRQRGLWKYPFSYLPPTHREKVVAAIAVALLGKRVIQHFDILLPVPLNELDLYPVSTALRRVWRGSSSELVERIQRWPFTFQERFWPSLELIAR